MVTKPTNDTNTTPRARIRRGHCLCGHIKGAHFLSDGACQIASCICGAFADRVDFPQYGPGPVTVLP